MLFSPAPFSMQGVADGKGVVLDNGVPIYGFSVYTAEGLLGRLER